MTLQLASAVPPLPDITLSDLSNFALIARAGGLRRAAAELACNPSSLSRSLRWLEKELAIPLLQRTTRSIALTEPGEALLASLSPALAGLASALEQLEAFRGTPCGRLRIHAPRPAVPLLLNRIVAGFISRYPDVRLEIRSDDNLVDAVAEGFDAAVRFRADVLPHMVAIPLGLGGRHVVVGTPSRVRALGRLDSPEELPVDALVAHREVDGQVRP